mmetsp:Transcript_23057/g.25739  ORF Transcript_23057/g.25739 Transcript_23057/m.25739 type:complete len:652 (-) Transcript_23057:141-2096(-)
MCGIHLRVWKDKSCEFCQRVFGDHTGTTHDDTDKDDFLELCDDNLRRRGPSACSKITTITHSEFYRIQVTASVLQMRAELREQPVSFIPAWLKDPNREDVDQDNHERNEEQIAYLCWNGEVYQQLKSLSSTTYEQYDNNNLKDSFLYEISDTNVVVDALSETPEQQNSPSPHCHIANVMARLYNAEFAFSIVDSNTVYFGRDRWGRRSLLQWKCPENCGSFQITSVAENFPTSNAIRTECSKTPTGPTLEWTEVYPGMVHCISFSEHATSTTKVYPNVIVSSPQLPNDVIVPPIPVQPLQTISDRLWRASLELEFYLRCAVTMRLDNSCRRSTGVLFSGGLDSVVLTALAADILSSQQRSKRKIESESEFSSVIKSNNPRKIQPIPILYLYNVSFGPTPEKSSDRNSALKSYQILREKYERNNQTRDIDDNCDDGDDNNLNIVFRDIVVEWEDVCRDDSHIRTLLLPKSTVMDVNIATALWFASQGSTINKTKIDRDICNDHRSPCVLLLGMGADELMGGYGRHRKSYEEGGWEQLRKELTMDQDRLWERNCGRDDRLISDHGREARFPFLDPHVVQFLRKSTIVEDLICDFRLPPGVGDKRILRLIAQRLGFEHASGLVKRAIQFGSRISHLSDKKRFGSRRKAKGKMKI